MPTSIEKRVELLRMVWLFSGCSQEELEHIAALVHLRAIDADTVVVREGEDGTEFFVVVGGTAVATVDGDPVGDLDAGSFFGEMALIDGGERMATVTATSDLHVMVLDRHDFNEMLQAAMPSVAPKLLQVMGERMRALARHDGKPDLGY